MDKFKTIFSGLSGYIVSSGFKGYDPYDTLNSYIPFEKFGRMVAAVAIQVQKKNPVNIRPLIGVKPGYNPKGLGLMLKAFSMLSNGKDEFRENADTIFALIRECRSEGFHGASWGYNFDWVNPSSSLPAYTPSVVVTSFVVDSLAEYYRLTRSEELKQLIIDASEYVLNDIPVTEDENGISFAYTHLSKGSCYNASLLAAEILAKADYVSGTDGNFHLVQKAVNFVLSKQKDDGSWYYSLNPESNKEYKQIDFHQGFVLVSLVNLKNLYEGKLDHIIPAVKLGLEFYRTKQFDTHGRARWRLPAEYPTDIHNQTQGIITFLRLSGYKSDYKDFAIKVADYTVNKFRDPSGYFYFRRGKYLVNKIPYIRWSQAWMLLALAELINIERTNV